MSHFLAKPSQKKVPFMKVLRTDDSRFENLSGYDFKPNFIDIETADQTQLRLHYLDEGPRDGEIILCMHGQPSWSYLYRKMIPILTKAGKRVLAPDLVGFGKSDKPTDRDNYSYKNHISWMNQWLGKLGVTDITLVCQDWGGLIGLRVLANNHDKFSRLVVANTGLPSSETITPELSAMMTGHYAGLPIPDAAMVREQFIQQSQIAFLYWIKYCDQSAQFSVRDVFKMLSNISDEKILDGYEAPIPDDDHAAGARAFPTLVPIMDHHRDDIADNDRAWKVLKNFEKPVLTAFSDNDPVTKNGEKPFQKYIPGAAKVTHTTIKDAGHFLQEDQPESLSQAILKFMKEN